jgi:hypothetical protein
MNVNTMEFLTHLLCHVFVSFDTHWAHVIFKNNQYLLLPAYVASYCSSRMLALHVYTIVSSVYTHTHTHTHIYIHIYIYIYLYNSFLYLDIQYSLATMNIAEI